ncbi:MAG: NUDIX hydrolase [Bacteroidales bacterium]|jgi:8-oxo-dGTP pyrophosphatase MutT (NUDIX family)|nr:NUDIX domain-containing protein [Bacteroidales bacterium]
MQKYTIFFNEAVLSIIIYDKNQLGDFQNNNDVIFEKNNFLEKKIRLFLEKRQSFSLYCLVNNIEKVWEYIKGFFIVEKAAGGIVLNNENKILTIKRWGFLDFPKGHIEKNESVEIAAIREVEEETDIHNLHIVDKIDNTYHVFIKEKQFVLKETVWFYMKTVSTDSPMPQIEENITEAYWFSMEEIDANIRFFYPSLQNLIVKLKNTIGKQRREIEK